MNCESNGCQSRRGTFSKYDDKRAAITGNLCLRCVEKIYKENKKLFCNHIATQIQCRADGGNYFSIEIMPSLCSIKDATERVKEIIKNGEYPRAIEFIVTKDDTRFFHASR